MTRLLETAIVAAALIAPPPAAPALFAQGAQAEPLRIIPTDSLFDRYTVESKWEALRPGSRGAG